MEKYNALLNKKISLCFNNDVINSYKITTIRETDRFMVGLEGNGKIFNCDVDWENKQISGGNKIMEFPESVFDDLINKGCAENPMMPNMYFKCESKEKMN
jgi:hypothetical protein